MSSHKHTFLFRCKVSLHSLGFYDTLIIFVYNNNNNNNTLQRFNSVLLS